MTDVILTSADITALAREHASHSRVCAALEGLSRQLLELTTVIQSVRLDNPSNELDNLTSELSWQLENARQLAQGLATYPDVYRAMSAARIRAQCLHVCRSIGDSLESEDGNEVWSSNVMLRFDADACQLGCEVGIP